MTISLQIFLYIHNNYKEINDIHDYFKDI